MCLKLTVKDDIFTAEFFPTGSKTGGENDCAVVVEVAVFQVRCGRGEGNSDSLKKFCIVLA